MANHRIRGNPRAFNYFGSKVQNAHRYPAPRFSTIIEPFAGGAGYSLLHSLYTVILHDKNPDIIRGWQYLINTPAEEIRRLPLIKKGQLVSDLKCDSEAKVMIGWCVHMTTYPSNRLSNWGEENNALGRGGYWGVTRREEMAQIAHKVKHWTARVRSYEDFDNVEATWFIDPPYFRGGEAYLCSNKDIDYERLAEWCRSRRGQVIVCERADATWLPFRPLYSMPTMDAQSGSRGETIEGIWTNDRKAA